MKRKPDTEIAEQDWNGTTTYKKFGGKFEKKVNPPTPTLSNTVFWKTELHISEKCYLRQKKIPPPEKIPPLRCTELQDLIR